MKNIGVGILALLLSGGLFAQSNESERQEICRAQVLTQLKSDAVFVARIKAQVATNALRDFPELSFSLFGGRSTSENQLGAFNLTYFLEDENLFAYFCGGYFVSVNPKLSFESAPVLLQRKLAYLRRIRDVSEWVAVQSVIDARITELSRLVRLVR